MAEIILYGVAVSAFVAKVRIVLDHKGIAYEERTPPGGYGSSEYRSIVPAGSVPGLTVDGRPLHDSNAIMEWIEETAPTPAPTTELTPHDPFDRAVMRALLGFHDTRLEAAARSLFPVIRNGWRAAPAPADAGVAAVAAALDRLADLIAPDPFILGEAPTLADLAFPVTLQMADMLAAEVGRPLETPAALRPWTEAASAIPAVARSLSIQHAAMEAWLASFR